MLKMRTQNFTATDGPSLFKSLSYLEITVQLWKFPKYIFRLNILLRRLGSELDSPF